MPTYRNTGVTSVGSSSMTHRSLRWATSRSNCQINVRRSHVIEDSYAENMHQAPNDVKRRLMITFEGEDGWDYGGLPRCVACSEDGCEMRSDVGAQGILFPALVWDVQTLLLSV